ncbi:hypothetical protein BP6252_12421 [Coleophoma cylindrospora]|uniref:Malate dehydrogenase n=1 Tax=Coleophoma cylindrospora TaxID=1849047 RepID=A0A3D8QH70_9HELO|nr:hypothetical protein BP6252_12421 [Coleophoma cylindrospora]
MPSLRSLLLGAGLATLLQAVTVAAAPSRNLPSRDIQRDSNCFPHFPSAPPTLPTTGDATELPSPAANMTLKFAAVGRGIQNYTCAASNSTPVALGAVATLFDGTSLASTNEAALNALPAAAVYGPVPNTSLTIHGNTLAMLGHHYFDATGAPTFDLSAFGDLLVGKKLASVNAPATADPGPAKTGAVAWLQLQDAGGSKGVSEVYRVVTAGGNPTACTAAGVITVPYAAEYWFYA